MANILQKQMCWAGTHHGIGWEVKCAETDQCVRDDGEVWTYYIFIHQASFPNRDIKLPTDEKGRARYSESIFASLPWHVECTYGRNHYNDAGEFVGIELGCDYNHYWDRDNSFYTDGVIQDAAVTIGELIYRYPEMLIRSMEDGKFYPQGGK